jgi:parvulin-like peptidyl-prolyl isomerase
MATKSTKEVEKEAAKDIEEEEESSSDADEEEEEEEAQEQEQKEAASDESDESDEEEEEEPKKPVVSARSVEDRRAARKRERERARAQEAQGHGHDDDEEATDGEDPYWWTPHAVMSVLVLVGVLGFFGAFNKVLGFMAAKPAGEVEKPVAAKEATPPPQPVRPPTPPGVPGADQQAREMFGAKHLLVMYKESRRAPPNVTRTKDEAKARATEAMKKAKDGKTKFEDLVKEYSDEPNAGARGGDLGTFPKGAMVPEFQTALEKIKVNEVSEVVETPFGFHVILRTK